MSLVQESLAHFALYLLLLKRIVLVHHVVEPFGELVLPAKVLLRLRSHRIVIDDLISEIVLRG